MYVPVLGAAGAVGGLRFDAGEGSVNLKDPCPWSDTERRVGGGEGGAGAGPEADVGVVLVGLYADGTFSNCLFLISL